MELNLDGLLENEARRNPKSDPGVKIGTGFQLRFLSLLLAVASAASCQTAAEILRSTADRYQSLKSYRFEAEYWQETATDDERQIFITTQIVAGDAASHLRRTEWRGGPLSALRIYDGHDVWEYRKSPNQFARADQAGYAPVFSPVVDPIETYGALGKAAARAKLLREETIEAAGGQRACWVIEVSPDSAADNVPMREPLGATWWIDKGDSFGAEGVGAEQDQIAEDGRGADSDTHVDLQDSERE